MYGLEAKLSLRTGGGLSCTQASNRYRGGRVHFIGVGGSSMSGLAGLLKPPRAIPGQPAPTAPARTRPRRWKRMGVEDAHRPSGRKTCAARNCDRLLRGHRAGQPRARRGCAAGHSADGALRPHRPADGGQRASPSACQRHPRQDHHHLHARAGVSDRPGANPTIHIGGELDYHRRFHAARRQRTISSSKPANSTAAFCTSTPPWRSSSTSTRTIWTASAISTDIEADVFAEYVASGARGRLVHRLGRRRARPARHCESGPPPVADLRAGRGTTRCGADGL